MSTTRIEYQQSGRQFIRTFLVNTVFEYFSPLFLSWGKFEKLKKEVDSLSNTRRALVVIQDATCFNQSALIQFTYLTAEKHKDLKDEYRKDPTNADAIADKLRELIIFANQDFHKNVYNNFEILHTYFSGRSKTAPRICIKGNFKTHHSDTIVSVFRDSEVSYQSDADIAENTGFSSIAKNGKYFLCNDLPRAAAEGLYVNPRLDISKIRALTISKKGTSSIAQHWIDCWKDSKMNKNKSSFYKSTLIVPMTLWNNDLSDEFRNKINITNVGRTIFGFLCMDHEEENFFNDDDVRVGYVFADFLSQHVFHRSVYTEISKTFGKAFEAISSKSKFTLDMRHEPLSKVCKLYQKDTCYKLELKESEDNYLFGLDEELMDYLGKKTKHAKP